MRTKSALPVLLLAAVVGGCGGTEPGGPTGEGTGVTSSAADPTTSREGTTPEKPDRPRRTTDEPPGVPPKVPGVPINVPENFGLEQTWRDFEANAVEVLTSLCGGTLCVKIVARPMRPTPGDCRIVDFSPKRVRSGDTFTFILDSPCREEGTAEETTEETTGKTTGMTTEATTEVTTAYPVETP
ncbi:hypothetical protein [Saccharothrix coeruleofusca]|uniref:Uncharacterized protein n=1 Tax=Saccharothrix coeruleofusca TaxID=33919 RepID=A0A918AKH9_9PSEU|nr:hypothetical protein [Saccharothrix coeruleofusca]GGP53001.1 hypothetical protein GCM10010185_26400 [Saccharothrix coeruleofusca]